jgi:heavy metal sensor kinase
MSLRWRLTLLSVLIMVPMFAIFGGLAFLTVRNFHYQQIDDNLQLRATANLLHMVYRHNRDLSELANEDRLDVVFFTVIDKYGRVVSSDRVIPVDPALFDRALAGETVKKTETMADGNSVRVLMTPIRYGPTGEVIGVLLAATPLDMTEELLQKWVLFLIGVVGVLLLVGAAGSYVLTGRALRVVENITSKARQIELSQDLTQRIPDPGTGDEVGHLVSTFNQMLARLQAAFEAQRRFVADSSHELRTPLTVIKSNLHLLRRTGDPDERAELFETTEAEVSRLNRMVNNLLYMAQMQAGHDIKPVSRPVELDSLLLEVFARARSMAALKNQKVSLIHEDIAAARGDRDQLQHALLNLIDNAVKYTPEGGAISLGLWTTDGWARIEVSDTGSGIAPNEVPLIFDRFFRTPEARRTERNGSGLGLSIVKSIVEAHGGRVEVTSVPGRGTTFRLWLPLIHRAEPLVPVQHDGEIEADAQSAPTGRQDLRPIHPAGEQD